MTLTRRDLVVKGGAVAAWATFGGVLSPSTRERSTDRRRSTAPPSRNRTARRWPSCGQSVTAEISKAFSETAFASSRQTCAAARCPEAQLRRVPRRPPHQHAAPADRRGGRRDAIDGRPLRRRRGRPGHRRDTEAVVEQAGLLEALDDARLRFVDLNEAPVVRVPLRTRYTGLRRALGAEDPARRRPRRLDAEAQDPSLGRATLSLKNCFGCMPGRVYGWPKDVFHVHNVPNSILDIVGAVRPSFAIIDGIVGMQGDGPLLGDPGALGRRRRLEGPGGCRRDRRAPDGHGAREDRVPDGSRPLPRPGAFRADRAARGGSGAPREAVRPRARVRARRRVGAPYCDQRDQIHTIRTARHTPMSTAYTPCTVIATTASAYAENGRCAPRSHRTRRAYDRAEG